MEQTNVDLGWRGSAELWLTAAYDLLLESGVDAVRILPLAKRLNLSRTSFYWFFKDRDELLENLLRRWKEKNTGNLLKQSTAYAETIVEAFLNVSDCWFDQALFDSKLEVAIRSWALQSPSVLEHVREADARRLAALTDMFVRHGEPAVTADARARTIYLLQIGYVSMQIDESIAIRMARLPEYMKILTGRQAKKREFDRFLSRHGMLQPHEAA